MFDIEERGAIASGKKGELPMYFLVGLKREFQDPSNPIKTNTNFNEKFNHLMKIYNT